MRNLLFLLLFVVSGCNNLKMIDNIGLFVFPEDAWAIMEDSVVKLKADEIRLPALCYWLDSTKCTPCEYDMLYNFEPYLGLAGEVSFFVIVSPPSVLKKQVDYKTTINGFSFPVIIDKDCSFYDKNKPVDLGENDYAYIFIDEEGIGYEYVLPGERMIYDIRRVFDYCEKNRR